MLVSESPAPGKTTLRKGPTRNRVLVVDDDPDALASSRDILETAGFRVTTARDGRSALHELRGPLPDVIVLDIRMPGRTGIEIADELARGTETARIPIVLLTALRDFATDPGLSILSSIRAILYKPCGPGTLVRGIKYALAHPL